MKISTLFRLATLATSTYAAALSKPTVGLDVTLTRESHSQVEVSIHNNGTTDLRLLNKGNILDKAETEKLQVYRGESKISFRGIRKKISMANLAAVTVPLKAHETIKFSVDAASLHDLSDGGRFDVVARGSIPYTVEGANTMHGVVQYRSNKLDLDVDGDAAAATLAHHAAIRKRAVLQADCTGDYGAATTAALGSCRELATKAAHAVLYDNVSRLTSYFGDGSTTAVSAIAHRYRAIALECATVDLGVTTQYCTDTLAAAACEETELAYTLVESNTIVNCRGYYTLPPLAATCATDDQAGTTLHEMTHAPAVYAPDLEDFAYGFDACIALPNEQKILNADNYLFYAQSVLLGCA